MNRKLAAAALVAVGTAQMAGDLTGLTALKALGAATHASPAPKVFTAQNGLETFSARFYIEWFDRSGALHSLRLTPETYRTLRGPYNRRNPYGATIAFAPQLAASERLAPVLDQVTRHGFCGRAPLLRELGIPLAEVASIEVVVVPREGQPGLEQWQTRFPVTCAEAP
ncbi:MAG TPA: hypothetical protein VG873_00435 [Burkholderiales bacterium]|nr:hypothetical protein [Burkholderiales bacterium]